MVERKGLSSAIAAPYKNSESSPGENVIFLKIYRNEELVFLYCADISRGWCYSAGTAIGNENGF